MKINLRFGFAALALFATLSTSTPVRAEGGYLFVRNARNGVVRLNNSALRSLLSSTTKQWPSGKSVQLVLPAEGSPELGWLASSFFGTNGRVLFTKILDKAHTGSAQMPVIVRSEGDALAAVARDEGALAIVKQGAALPAGVAVLEIE